MDKPRSSPIARLMLAAQIGIAAIITLIAGIAPPAHGAMLIIPGPNAVGQPADLIGPADARLRGRGPWPGSLVVEADRERLTMAALDHGMIVIAAPEFLCGNGIAARGTTA